MNEEHIKYLNLKATFGKVWGETVFFKRKNYKNIKAQATNVCNTMLLMIFQYG